MNYLLYVHLPFNFGGVKSHYFSFNIPNNQRKKVRDHAGE